MINTSNINPTNNPLPNNYSTNAFGGYAMGTSVCDNSVSFNQFINTIEIKGKMILNGQDLEERLNTIEKVLLLPERNVILEEKYPKLKKMHDAYIAQLEKYSSWHALTKE